MDVELGPLREVSAGGVRTWQARVGHPLVSERWVEIRADAPAASEPVGAHEPRWDVDVVERTTRRRVAAGLTLRGAQLRAMRIVAIWRQGHLTTGDGRVVRAEELQQEGVSGG